MLKTKVISKLSGAVGLAGSKKLLHEGIIDPKDRVIIPITGTGFKDSDFFLQGT